MVNEEDYKERIYKGIIDTKSMVELFGSPKNIDGFKKNGKINDSIKRSLLNKSSRYCNIIDMGKGKYEIVEVYVDLKPINLGKLQSGIYHYMAPIILLKLLEGYNDKDNVVKFPLIDWALYIDMINQNYNTLKFNQKIAGEYLDIDILLVKEFFDKLSDNIRYYMEHCLDHLQKANVLIWYKLPFIRKRRIERVDSKNEDVNISCTYTDTRASEEEIRYIKDCETLVKSILQIKNNNECFYGAKSDKYKDKMKKLLIKKDILYFYDCYEVYYTDIDKCKNLLKEFTYENEENLIKNFNIELIDGMVDNAQKRHDKTIADEIVKQYRLNENYINDFKTLSEITIYKDNERNMYKEMGIKKEKNTEKLLSDFNINIIDDRGNKLL